MILANMLEDFKSLIHWKSVRLMWKFFMVQEINTCKTTPNLPLGKSLCHLHLSIQHDKTLTNRYLNGQTVHLNKRGPEILSNTFIKSLANITHWQIILHSSGLNSEEKLSILRKRNIDTTIVAHFNINSFRNKFDDPIARMTGRIDILMASMKVFQ